MSKCAVVILNWNGKQMLEAYLPSVVKYSNGDGIEVVVADNNSSDDSVSFIQEYYPQIKLVCLAENYGFAEGYNRALLEVNAEYYLLLNSDVRVSPSYLEALIEALDEDPGLWVCMPKLCDEAQNKQFEYAGASGGFLDSLGYPYCRGRIFNHVEMDHGQYNDPIPIFWATGAAMMIRSSVFHALGGFDSAFFAHMEEIDLCWRIHSRGGQIKVIPSSIVYHVGGGSLQATSPFKTYLNFRNNLLMLYKNMNKAELVKVLFFRFFLDQTALWVFVCKGEFKHAWAVVRAHKFFWFKGIKAFKKKRAHNLQSALPERSNLLKPTSILWRYYVKGQKKYSQL